MISVTKYTAKILLFQMLLLRFPGKYCSSQNVTARLLEIRICGCYVTGTEITHMKIQRNLIYILVFCIALSIMIISIVHDSMWFFEIKSWITNEVYRERYLKYAHILCFENDIHKEFRTYSTGMKQKLRLIQALMEKPKYLLLDEPFDGLDTEAKNIVKKLLEDYLSIEGNTHIFTNHEEDIALENETVYVIRDHQILTE